jgi:phosphoribosyl 1,2-cyclic phosphodiesterase
MRVRFWGVRGTVPWATAAAIGFGCNTPCVEVRDDATGAFLILDGGSGLVGLSATLDGAPRPVPVLLTHYHWDHTQGLPFFAPLWTPGWSPSIHAPALHHVTEAWLPTIFQLPNFPVPFESLPNRPTMTLIGTAPFSLGGFEIAVHLLTHPGGAYAYRLRGATGDLCYVTDHEFGERATDAGLAAFCRGCAAMIVDAHFTPEELRHHAGWGHSSWQQAAHFARDCGAGRLWLFHHKPGRTDAELHAIETEARHVFPLTDAAREGASHEL